MEKSAFLNIDLRSILAITRWSADENEGELTPRADLVRRSLVAPVRADVIGEVLAKLNAAQPRNAHFVPLGSLTNWRVTEEGLSERTPRQGFSVAFFEVAAQYREVPAWIQPLVDSATPGHAVLACRERGGLLEFFIRARSEPGLATGAALAPSFLRYPGEEAPAPAWLERAAIWSSTEDLDEGGRFYQDVSAYQLVRVDEGEQPRDEDGAWLRLSERKLFLRTSNICTIQLRGLASHLLAVR